MSTWMQDIKFALRLLVKSPGFAAVSILIMALGIGANTAIFSVVHAVVLEPLPFRDSARLVQLWHVPPQANFPGTTRFALSAANFLDWQKQNHVFEQMALYCYRQYDLTGRGKPEAIAAAGVSFGFFPVLGVPPLKGRVFLPQEDRPGADHVVVLSYKFWQTHYAADPAILGRSIRLDGEPYTVVGVMGPRMTKPDSAQLWTPLALTPAQAAVRGEHHYLGIARLKPGVTIAQAQAEMNTISQALERAYPEDDKGWGAVVVSLREDTVGEVRPALLMMLGAVAFVLLIACANVANLLLSRMLARRKEIAIRAALGASRARVLRQLLCENVILSFCGGALGLVVAHAGIQLILRFIADKLPRFGEIGLDATVLGFTFAIAILSGLLSGLLPAWTMTRGEVSEALKQGLGHTDADSGSSKTHSLLVTVEVALSFALLMGAGLMTRSLWKLETINAGFDQRNVLTLAVMISRQQFPTAVQESQFFDRVLARVRALPQVEAAGAIDSLPLAGGSNQPIAVEGRPAVAMSEQPEVSVRVVTPGYFRALRIPLLEGRDLTAADTPDSTPVVVVSQSLAKQFWPDASPIGHDLKLTFFPDKERVIVGVVGDVKQNGLDSSAGVPTLYWPIAQVTAPVGTAWQSFPLSLAVRTSSSPANLGRAVASAVHDINPEVPVDSVLTLKDFVGETLSQRSFNMQLLASFGLLALLLCAVGIYSMLAYSTRRRMREIALRVAFGARLRDVIALVVAQGIKPTLAGLAMGAVSAVALGRAIASLIYGVSSLDLLTFSAVAMLLLLVAFAASLIPALRATRVDPLAVLREE